MGSAGCLFADGVPTDRELHLCRASMDPARFLVRSPQPSCSAGGHVGPDLRCCLRSLPPLTLPRQTVGPGGPREGKVCWPVAAIRRLVQRAIRFRVPVGRHAVDHRRAGFHRVERSSHPQRGWAGTDIAVHDTLGLGRPNAVQSAQLSTCRFLCPPFIPTLFSSAQARLPSSTCGSSPTHSIDAYDFIRRNFRLPPAVPARTGALRTQRRSLCLLCGDLMATARRVWPYDWVESRRSRGLAPLNLYGGASTCLPSRCFELLASRMALPPQWAASSSQRVRAHESTGLHYDRACQVFDAPFWRSGASLKPHRTLVADG